MKFSVHFGIKKKQTDPSKSLIRVRISWPSGMVEMLTGWQCPTDAWDKAAENVKNRKEYRELRDDISRSGASISQFFLQCRLDGRIPSKMEVYDAARESLGMGTKRSESIFDAIDRFANTIGAQNGWSESTRKKFITLRNHLRAWQPRLEFNDLTEANISKFVRYLYGLGHRNTNVAKRLSDLRWFCRWAEHEGLLHVHDYADFRPRLKGTDGANKEIIYLEIRELMDIYNLDLTGHDGLAATRDVFCFCCFSGLRYSDVSKLHRSDIYEDCIHVVTQKTTDRLSIELNDHTRAILRKYEGSTFSRSGRSGLALPVVSNQKMNDALKVIAKMAHVETPTRIVYYRGSERIEEVHPKWELVSTHCARRTFVVTALQLGIPAEVVMKFTGHSDYDSMRPYVAIVDTLKKQSMDKFSSLFPEKSQEQDTKNDKK